MGCKDAVLPRSLSKDHTVICLTYEENTRKPYSGNLSLFRDLASNLHGNWRLEEEPSKVFTFSLEKTGGTNAAGFQGVCMKDIPIVEDLVQVNIFLYDIDFVHESMMGELVRKNVGKHSNTLRLLRYNSQFFVFDINVLFEVYRRPSCDTFFNRA